MSEQSVHPQTYADQLDQWIDAELSQQENSTSIESEDELIVSRLLEEAKAISPAPAFVDNLSAQIHSVRRSHPATGKVWLFGKHHWRRLAVGALSLLIFGCIGLLVSPQTRATLLDVINGMRIVDADRFRRNPIEVVIPQVEQPLPPRSLSEIVAQTPFTFRFPTELPQNLIYANGFVDRGEEGETVSLVFLQQPVVASGQPIPVDTPTLFLIIQRGKQSTQPMLDSSVAEPVQINRQPALYAKGGWKEVQPDRNSLEKSLLNGVVWEEEIDANWLTWQADDLTYWLQADGLKLDKAAMIDIAESFEEAKP